MSTADDVLAQWLSNGEMSEYNADLLPESPEMAEICAVSDFVPHPQINTASDLELAMWREICNTGLPLPQVEYRFCGRRWRFDFSWPEYKIAVECEGGTRKQTGGGYSAGHAHPERFRSDCEKYNHAAVLGWLVLRFTAEMIDLSAAALIQEAFKARNLPY